MQLSATTGVVRATRRTGRAAAGRGTERIADGDRVVDELDDATVQSEDSNDAAARVEAHDPTRARVVSDELVPLPDVPVADLVVVLLLGAAGSMVKLRLSVEG